MLLVCCNLLNSQNIPTYVQSIAENDISKKSCQKWQQYIIDTLGISILIAVNGNKAWLLFLAF